MMALPTPFPRSVRGFTLLEVLIAVLVLSLGLLGLAALQSVGLRSNHSAYHRSQATQLGYDIIDRMRTNKDKASTYDIRTDDAATDPSPDCTEESCNTDELADYEKNKWKQQISDILPSGNGAIDCTTSSPVCIITVVWDDTRGGGEANQSFVMSTQL